MKRFIVISISLLEINDELIKRFNKAVINGNVSLVNKFLDDGVQVDSEEFNDTPLRHAAMENRTDVTLLLLHRGADVNKRSGLTQSTALHMAAQYNNTDVIEVLLKHGASTNIKDDEGRTPINLARAKNNEAAVRLLERH